MLCIQCFHILCFGERARIIFVVKITFNYFHKNEGYLDGSLQRLCGASRSNHLVFLERSRKAMTRSRSK